MGIRRSRTVQAPWADWGRWPRRSLWFCAFLFLVSQPPLLYAQGVPEARTASAEGALFLLLPSGAQGVAMGRAMTAVGSAESAFWNPAGLVSLEGGRAILVRGEHVAGEATGVSFVRGGGREEWAFGLSYQMLDVGSQDLTDQDRQVVGSITIRSHQGIVSVGRPFGQRVRGGINLKSIQYRVTCRGQCPDGTVSASSWATDLGIQATPFLSHPLEVGFMVAHLGTDFTVRDSGQSDPLPARVRVALSYDLLERFVEDQEVALRIVSEVEDRLRNPGNLAVFLGGQVSAAAAGIDEVSVRGGYVWGGGLDRNQTAGAGLGFGVRFDRFEFGIARSLSRGGPTSGEEPVHITLGLVF